MNRAFIKGVPPEESGFDYLALGSIVGNLLTLEFALRFFLHETLGEERQPDSKPVQLACVCKGQRIPCNHLTNYSALGCLIKEANKKLGELDRPERVDPSLVHLRDAIAHGRVFSNVHPTGPYRLLKFSSPRKDDGMVQVEVSIELNQEWWRSQVQQTAEAVNKMQKVLLSLYPSQTPIVEAAD